MKRVFIDQSGARIGVSSVRNLNLDSIAGQVISGRSSEPESEDDRAGEGESIGVAYSNNVYVKGVRVS